MSGPSIILSCSFDPSLEEYRHRIRFDDLDDAQTDAMQLYWVVKQKLVPKVLMRELYIDEHVMTQRSVPGLKIGTVLLEGNVLKVLESSWRVIAYVVTCGDGMESYDLAALDMLAPYWLDVLKTLALDTARQTFLDYCTHNFGMHKASSVNPGSGNLDAWPIEQLHLVFKLLGNAESIGVVLTGQALMIPNKTIAGLLFNSEEMDYESCAFCKRPNCPSRKVPYTKNL